MKLITDGTFNSSTNGIVHNLNKLRLYGYDYNDGYVYQTMTIALISKPVW